LNIQIFGKSKCFETKKAERYFKERRIKFQRIDIIGVGMSSGEFKSVKSAVGLNKIRSEANPSLVPQYQDTLNASQYNMSNKRFVVGPITAEKEKDLVVYYQEIASKIVTGQLPLDEFDKWVAFYNANGGAQIIEEANRLN